MRGRGEFKQKVGDTGGFDGVTASSLRGVQEPAAFYQSDFCPEPSGAVNNSGFGDVLPFGGVIKGCTNLNGISFMFLHCFFLGSVLIQQVSGFLFAH